MMYMEEEKKMNLPNSKNFNQRFKPIKNIIKNFRNKESLRISLIS